jgi:hypothetical protein
MPEGLGCVKVESGGLEKIGYLLYSSVARAWNKYPSKSPQFKIVKHDQDLTRIGRTLNYLSIAN